MKSSILVFCFNLLVITSVGAQSQKDLPTTVFNEVWDTFNEEYANFEIRNVDWKEKYAVYKPMIKPNMSSDELFDVTCQMLKELNDAHVSLIDKTGADVKRCNSNNFPDSTSIYKNYGRDKFYETVDKTLEKQGFSPLVTSDNIEYAKSEGYGYIRISGMRKFGSQLKEALRAVQDTRGLIIDIRLNPGGSDPFLYQIAGRFADKKRVGHYKRTRKIGTNELREPEVTYLKPTGKFQYTRPIILLTSDFTASAAEVFVLAMKQLPYVTVVGGYTNGAMSHMKPVKLSNNWLVSLSHQRTYSHDMTCYESIGIKPDILIEDDFNQNYDNVLLRALKELD